jgi:hypothetical protein
VDREGAGQGSLKADMFEYCRLPLRMHTVYAFSNGIIHHMIYSGWVDPPVDQRDGLPLLRLPSPEIRARSRAVDHVDDADDGGLGREALEAGRLSQPVQQGLAGIIIIIIIVIIIIVITVARRQMRAVDISVTSSCVSMMRMMVASDGRLSRLGG